MRNPREGKDKIHAQEPQPNLMQSVALICTANICRSVMAHAILAAEIKRRDLALSVCSAGIWDSKGAPPALSVWTTCLQHQTPVPKMESTFIEQLDLANMDYFLVMEAIHARALITALGIPESKVSMLSSYDPSGKAKEITDPMSNGMTTVEQCYLLIQDCLQGFLRRLGHIKPDP